MENGIYKAMASITREIGAITKDKDCEYGKYRYRGIDDVYNAINPLMGKHGVFVLPLAQERHSEIRNTKKGAAEYVILRMLYRFCHEDGSYVECATIGEAMDSGDKGTNKAMAIAHKYAILQIFCIPTEDLEDPDAKAESFVYENKKKALEKVHAEARAQNPQPATDPQRKKLFAIMGKRHGNNREAMLKDLSSFLGRQISSSNELSKDEISDFINAAEYGNLEEEFA